jgi:hypothetical protein
MSMFSVLAVLILLIALELGEGRYYTKYQKPGVVTV